MKFRVKELKKVELFYMHLDLVNEYLELLNTVKNWVQDNPDIIKYFDNKIENLTMQKRFLLSKESYYFIKQKNNNTNIAPKTQHQEVEKNIENIENFINENIDENINENNDENNQGE